MISNELRAKLEGELTQLRLAIVWYENQIKCCNLQINVIKSALED